MSKRTNTGGRRLTSATLLQHIQQFSTSLASASNTREFYQQCIVELKKIFNFDYTFFLLFDGKKDKFITGASEGFTAQVEKGLLSPEISELPSLSIKTGKVEFTSNFSEDNRFGISEDLKQLDIHAGMAICLSREKKIYGVISGYNIQARPYTETERLLLQTLAEQAIIGLESLMRLEAFAKDEINASKKVKSLQLEKKQSKTHTEELESIFSTIGTGVILLKDGRTIAKCNEKLAELFGYPSAEKLIGVSAKKLHQSEEKYREFGRNYYSNLTAGEVVEVEYTLKTRDGNPILCRMSGKAVDQMQPPDISKGFVWVIDDITRSKEMEEEVLQARKLESIGILAGGIGHDFNNILSAILGNLGLAERLLEADTNVQDLIKSAIEAAVKAKDLTAKLLIFTRRDSHSIGSVNLPNFFRDYNFNRFLGEGIDLEVAFQAGLFPIKIMPDHLKAIVQNLLLNADGCMPRGGKVNVQAYNVAVLEDDIPGLNAGKYVEVSVADNGCGIENSNLENIFDPYFTTKNRDSTKGIGLGLAIVHSIVKRNNGTITVKSSKKRGTVFTILLPAFISDILEYEMWGKT